MRAGGDPARSGMTWAEFGCWGPLHSLAETIPPAGLLASPRTTKAKRAVASVLGPRSARWGLFR